MTAENIESIASKMKQAVTRPFRNAKMNWSLHLITYPLLIVYFMPIIVIAWVTSSTDTFLRDPQNLTEVARAIAGPFFDVMRSTLSAIFVPFVMAYAIRNRKEGDPIPASTIFIFFVFLGLFIASAVLYGIVEYRQTTLSRKNVMIAGKEVEIYTVLNTILVAYAKESLTYIALVLGIALRPAMNSAASKQPA